MSANVVITLGSFSCPATIDSKQSQGAPPRDLPVVTNPLADMPVQVTDAMKDFRAFTFVAKIVGLESLDESAADNKVRQIHNLMNEVAKDSNTLTVVGVGRSMVTAFQVVKSVPFTPPWDELYEFGDEALVPVTLNLRPWSIDTPVTQVLGSSMDTPTLVALNIDGEAPTPITMAVTRAFTGSGLQSLLLACVPASATLSDLLMLAKNTTGSPGWANYTASWGYASGSNNVQIVTSTDWKALYWLPLPAGLYGLWAKVRVQAGGKGWLAQSKITDAPSTASVTVNDNDWDFFNLGAFASDGYSPFSIVGKVREAANGMILDWVLAVPLDYGSAFEFFCSQHSVAAITVPWLDGPTIQFTSGPAIVSARRYCSGPGLRGVGAVQVLMAACDQAGSGRRPAVSASATWTPRYTHWIPTPEA